MRPLLLLAFGAGCAAHVPVATAPAAPPAPPEASAAPAPAPVTVASAAEPTRPDAASSQELEQALTQACSACHSLSYVRQQRMTSIQWMGTLTKMRTWGALLDEAAIPRLAEALALQHGPAASLPAPATVDVPAFIPPSSRPAPRAALQRGRALFAARCVACHGADARGGLGVNLGDEQLLQEPHRFAATVRAGRGLMPPNPDLTDAQLAELRAWLETL